MKTWPRGTLVFAPNKQTRWLVSHAAFPVADRLEEDRYRVYFSGRDEQGRQSVGHFGLVLSAKPSVIDVCDRPVLSPGALGTFDDSGVTSSSLVDVGGRKYLYYTGWTRGVSVPVYSFAGLAISEDGGGTFTRASRGPLLERNDVDPFETSSPCVLREGAKWRMWYVSSTGWTKDSNHRRRHHHHIKYAESMDGVQWKRTGQVAIDYASEAEHAIGRPTVLLDDGIYKMWFCCRGDAYKFGYAESRDGIRWDRKDSKAGWGPSGEAWDSEMQAYPFVFRNRGSLHLLYNGNGLGETGIGWAAAKAERPARKRDLDPDSNDFQWQG